MRYSSLHRGLPRGHQALRRASLDPTTRTGTTSRRTILRVALNSRVAALHDRPPYARVALTYACLSPFTGHTYGDTSFRCHDFASITPTTTITAGGTLDLAWRLIAPHPGDCSLWIAYPNAEEEKDAPPRWIKLFDFIGCHGQDDLGSPGPGVAPKINGTYQVTLPDWLPSSTHAVLRWEWIALHVYTDMELYANCVDVVVRGMAVGSIDTFYSSVSPVTAITGYAHLPQAAVHVTYSPHHFHTPRPPDPPLNPTHPPARSSVIT